MSDMTIAVALVRLIGRWCQFALMLPFMALGLYLSALLTGVELLLRILTDPIAQPHHMLRCSRCGTALSIALACWGPLLIGVALLLGVHR